MQYVFQAADLSKYDHDAAMSKYGFIDWGVNTTLNIGDIVFLYFKTPVQKIRYKTVVEKIIYNANEICGDEFWKDGNKRKEKDKYYRLKLVANIDDERLSYGYLKEHGVISTLQGSEEVKPETLIYINSVLDDKKSDAFLSISDGRIVSFSCGPTYDLVRKTQIHAHPIKNGFPANACKYLMVRATGGISHEIYEVVDLVELNPLDEESVGELKNKSFYDRIALYINERKLDFGFKSAPLKYRFYVLKSIYTFNPVYKREPNIQGYEYLSFEQLGIGTSDSKVIFCNIAYMKYYRGITPDDIPRDGGKFVSEEKNAMEKYSFLSSDGKVFGFVETKHKDGYKTGSANKLHIERIDKSALQSEYVSGVTVIFCAKKNTNETVIVGWYDDAQVFAVRKKVKDINGDPWEYNIVTDAENAHLIDENNRTFQVPRTKSKDEPGFGSSNIWYADDDKSRVIKASALEYIDSIRNKNIVSFDEEEKEIDELYKDEHLQETEREVLAKARIGQGIFRERLIQRDGCCRICGIRNKELLKASHIKPWKNCKNSKEKLNEENGLLLCAIHDALFDRGLICFDEEGHIIISDGLSEGDRKILALDDEFQLSMSDEMKSFMSWRLNSLLNDVNIVYHNELGKGTVITNHNNEITVRFYKGNKEIIKTYIADAAFKKGTLKRHI